MTNKTYDILIVGGGLTGSLAALTLSREGFSVGIIEGQTPTALRSTHFDGRTTAIAYASMRMFKRLKLWNAIAPFAEPIEDILVTDGRHQSRFREGGLSSFHMHFDSAELDQNLKTPLGWIVENQAIRNALFDQIDQTDAINLYAPSRTLRSDFDKPDLKSKACTTLEDGQQLKASLILGADGKRSRLRTEAGIRVNQWQYQQTGLVATITHERPHDGFAQEYFLPGGPFAILPMTSTQSPIAGTHFPHRSSLVWSEKKAIANQLIQLDDIAFAKELEDRFGPYLGKLAIQGRRFSYPLSFHLSHNFVKPRLALIGDAARAIHPIAGQGFNLAIKDIAAIADVLVEARSIGLDIGHMSVLQNYQQWRRFDSVSLALGTDIINRLFSNDAAPLRLTRDIGLGVVNKLEPLRKFFMRQAGADIGDLPSLLKPE